MHEPEKWFPYLLPKEDRKNDDAMLNKLKASPGVPVWDSKTYKYAIFSTPKQLEDYILSKEPGDRTLNEVIFGDKPLKIYVDVDGCPPDVYEKIRKSIREVWCASDLPDKEKYKVITMNTRYLGNCEIGYIFRHIIINYPAKNYEEVAKFAGKIREKLGEENAKYIDMHYGKIMNLRLLHCSKWDNAKPGPPKVLISSDAEFSDSLVGFYSHDRIN